MLRKSDAAKLRVTYGGVTPCVGVWIETKMVLQQQSYRMVTPCVGVWIETLCRYV